MHLLNPFVWCYCFKRGSLISWASYDQDHRNAYVRRHAIFAAQSIYKNAPNLIPDASELLVGHLSKELDPAVRRNTFLSLIHVDLDAATTFLVQTAEQLGSADDLFQLAAIELIRRDSRKSPQNKVFVSLVLSSTPSLRAIQTHRVYVYWLVNLVTPHCFSVKQFVSCSKVRGSKHFDESHKHACSNQRYDRQHCVAPNGQCTDIHTNDIQKQQEHTLS